MSIVSFLGNNETWSGPKFSKCMVRDLDLFLILETVQELTMKEEEEQICISFKASTDTSGVECCEEVTLYSTNIKDVAGVCFMLKSCLKNERYDV